jgi:hypothetical protein
MSPVIPCTTRAPTPCAYPYLPVPGFGSTMRDEACLKGVHAPGSRPTSPRTATRAPSESPPAASPASAAAAEANFPAVAPDQKPIRLFAIKTRGYERPRTHPYPDELGKALFCEECGCVSGDGRGWIGQIAFDPEDGLPPNVVVFCLPCAASEFGYRPDIAAQLRVRMRTASKRDGRQVPIRRTLKLGHLSGNVAI